MISLILISQLSLWIADKTPRCLLPTSFSSPPFPGWFFFRVGFHKKAFLFPFGDLGAAFWLVEGLVGWIQLMFVQTKCPVESPSSNGQASSCLEEGAGLSSLEFVAPTGTAAAFCRHLGWASPALWSPAQSSSFRSLQSGPSSLLRLSDSLSWEFQPRGLAFLSFAFGVSSSELGWQLLSLLCLGQLLILVLLVFWQAAFSLLIRTFSTSFLEPLLWTRKGIVRKPEPQYCPQATLLQYD